MRHREGRCLPDRVSFGRLLLAVSAEGSCGRSSPVPARIPLTLAEICCRGALPSRSSFSLAQRLEMPSGQRVCLGLRPARDLYRGAFSQPWKIRGCPGAASGFPRIAHPRPAPAHAHLTRSFILNPHPQVSQCLDTWIPSPTMGRGDADPDVLRLLPTQGPIISLSAPLLSS